MNIITTLLVVSILAMIVGIGLIAVMRKAWLIRDWTRVRRLRFLLCWLLGITALIVVREARADQGIQDFAITNVVRSNTTVTVNLGSGLKISEQDQCGIMLMGQGDAAGSSGVLTLTFARSVDGTNWETHPKFTVLSAVNGTTAILEYTNLSSAVIGAAGWIKPVSVQSADTSANLTNVFLYLSKKNTKRAP
jgi:hypothetical protein